MYAALIPEWDEPKHFLLMGDTGSGKSALMRQILWQLTLLIRVPRGADVFWLEPCEVEPFGEEPDAGTGEAIRHLRSRTLSLPKDGTSFQQVTRR